MVGQGGGEGWWGRVVEGGEGGVRDCGDVVWMAWILFTQQNNPRFTPKMSTE